MGVVGGKWALLRTGLLMKLPGGGDVPVVTADTGIPLLYPNTVGSVGTIGHISAWTWYTEDMPFAL